AGFRVGEALRFFDRSSPSNGISLTASPDQRARFAGLQTSRLNRIEDSLRSLRGTVSRLLSQESLSTRTSESSRPDLVQARPGPDSPVTTFSVRPDRKASGNVLVSDAQPASVSTLGLSGTFFVNGFPVEVEPTDSLFDLRDKINRGEDRNGNGVLDRDEDVNQNGQVDRFGRDGTEFGPGVFVIEDLNGNGILDPAEDTNDNRRLDGGTRDLQVVARVRDQRLELTSLGGGNQRIDLRDEDNVLLALGFFELNAKGLPILNERQFADRNPPVNLNREP
ncbi:MAG: hypothetical protein GWM98_04250, partial [Nitrospinaceae bacterium]|nr:hypothetical protein [Nitrospinaceae bacterium]NIS84269.1 hypothetical protein [Nitrospinaceae bacterium]NIT81076.1 hypothetical protein [Nitrospinaceae bacterium]NIU95479.1 hypothetical protein [Nitrospinaceae bacterium]NIY14132.1 hypothetical protein [Nitrospinaceae bacterium]